MNSENEFLGLPVIDDARDLGFDKPFIGFLRATSDNAKYLIGDIDHENRHLRKSHRNMLVNLILSGEWRNDHTATIVLAGRRVIDGQHRLSAFIEAGVARSDDLLFRVQTGAHDDLRKYIDTGLTRTLADRVNFTDDKQANVVISHLCAFERDMPGGRNKKPTPNEAMNFFRHHERSCLFVARWKTKQKGVGSIPVAYAAMEYFEKNDISATDFYSSLFVVDSCVQQARVFRDYLLRCDRVSSKASRRDAYERAVWCMKMHETGKVIRSVRRTTWG